MKAKHKILYISNNTVGGVGTIILTLVKLFNNKNYMSKYITSIDNPKGMFRLLYRVLANRFGFIKIKSSKESYDIFHFQGAWTLHLVLLCFVKYTKTVVSPHGAFNKVSLLKSKRKKQIASFLFMRSAYKSADCITAASEIELNDIKDYGVRNVPIALIPNGINLEEDLILDSDYKKELIVLAANRKIILSLSRLDVSKGIDLLLKAFNDLKNRENYVLFIVGDGDEEYKKQLEIFIKNHQLENSVFMLGFKKGLEKNTLYDVADLFVLPSYNEGFGMTILEALRQNTPVITTTGTPFSQLPEKRCGWYVAPDGNAIKKAIEDFDGLNNSEILQMHKNGLNWLKDDFDEKAVAVKMDLLYKWLLKRERKPDFVY